jgi:hypothetical protein
MEGILLKEKYELVQQAVLTYLSENKGKRYFNHAIQFSSMTKKMYCLYFRNNNIYDIPQLIVPTLLLNDDVHKFELKMLNKNIKRVAEECLYIIHLEPQWHIDEDKEHIKT